MLSITFTCDIGLEEQYTYKTQQIGNAGTGYICDHNGQLCLAFTDTVSDNAPLPLTVSHVYNSQNAGSQRTEITENNVNLFNSMRVGKGFMLNTQTSVTPFGNNSFLKYTDGDGTVHYLTLQRTLNGSHYYISDDQALSAVDASSQLLQSNYSRFYALGFHEGTIIEDLQKNCMLYYKGLPAAFFDSCGNKVLYLYNTSTASGTTWFPKGDGTDQLYRIHQYNHLGNGSYSTQIMAARFVYSGQTLDRIISSRRTVYFDYDVSDRLETVSVNQVEHNRDPYEPTATFDIAQYRYNSAGFITAAHDMVAEYGVSYTETNGKYSGYWEFAGNLTVSPTSGAYCTITYEPQQTKYVFYGNGNDIGERTAVSAFDKYGRSVCSYTINGDDQIPGQTVGAYSNESNLSRNRLLSTASTGLIHENLLYNPSFERYSNLTVPDCWTVYGASGLTAASPVHSGELSLKISSANGETKSFMQELKPANSHKVCFSVYVNLSDVSNVNENTGNVCLSIKNGNQTVLASKSYGMNSELFSGWSEATEKKSVWRRLWVSTNVTGGQSYSFSVCIEGITGSVYFDDAQVEYSEEPALFNALSAGNIYYWNRGWALTDTTCLDADNQTVSLPDDGVTECYFEMLGDHFQNSAQQIVRGTPGKSYLVSGWAKADALAPLEPNGVVRFFGIKVTVDYDENTNQTDETYYFPGNPYYDGWQLISGSVLPKNNAPYNIIVEPTYINTCNTAYFTRLSLAESRNVGYTYDSNGDLVETEKTGLQSATYTYNDHKLTGFSKPNVSASVIYETSSNSCLPLSLTTADVTAEYEYDGAGNVTETTVHPAGNSNADIIMSQTEYNAYHSKATKTTDSLNTETEYVYYSDGVLKRTKTNGTFTDYTYDIMGRVSRNWITGLASVQYTYTGSDLTGITTGLGTSTVEYTFTVDSFGRTLSTSAGDSTLASYTYGSPLGELRSVKYGDPLAPLLTITYFYDTLGRVQKIRYGNSDRFLYSYDCAGNLSSFTDRSANVKYIYEYDAQGRLLFEEQYQTVSPYAYLQGQYYTYNTYGDLKTSAAVMPGIDTKRQTFTYKYEEANPGGDKTALSKIEYEGVSYKATRTYDALNRPSSDQITVSNGSPVLTKTYAYRAGAVNGYTTPLVSSLQYTGISLGFSYTYDALGNIVEIRKNNQLYATYKYDALGQLTRENNAAANRTYVYKYDSHGNITARRTHYLEWNTATENLSSPISTDSYTYMSSSDGMWGDVLKKYNNSKFSYDAIGNPTVYNNGSAYTFTWTDGRRLASGTKGTASFAYAYNANGLRTQKVVGNTTYDYYWNGTRLEAMTVTQGQNTEKLLFYYDADGAPYALKYYDRAACLWRTFLYVTNLQGDVVALIDAGSGSAAATYEYDAWGRLVSESISPLPAHALLQYNPLTYRGYIYDEETGFYYLQTRYYDPATRRFLNADGYVSTGTGLLGYNMFAYCNNNPVMRSDPSGEFFEWICAIAICAICVFALVSCSNSETNNHSSNSLIETDFETNPDDSVDRSFQNVDEAVEYMYRNMKSKNLLKRLAVLDVLLGDRCEYVPDISFTKMCHQSYVAQINVLTDLNLFPESQNCFSVKDLDDIWNQKICMYMNGKQLYLKDDYECIIARLKLCYENNIWIVS